MDINRINFTKAVIKRVINGDNPPAFMKHYSFKVKGDKIYYDSPSGLKVVIPTEEREDYLRKALFANKSKKPFGRDSLHYAIMKEAVNVGRRDILKFLKQQNVIVSRTARPNVEKREFVSSINKAGVCSGDLAHIRHDDVPEGFMPTREDADPDTEWTPETDDKDMSDAKVWKTGTHKKGDRYFYNLVDIYTGWLETIVIGTKKQEYIAEATKKLVDRMGKALGTPVTVVNYDMGGEFLQSIRELKAAGIKTFQKRTNAEVEQANAKLQRIFYTIVAQKRTDFKGSVKQAVDIANNTKNRKLGMTPQEAVEKLRAGQKPEKKRAKTSVRDKNVYKEGTLVRALKKKRDKQGFYKAYKGKHFTKPMRITKVSFYQGHPKYTLDKSGVNVRGVSTKRWHDQLTLAEKVDKKSQALVKRREDVEYKAGDDVWFRYKGEKLKARLKNRDGSGWNLKFYGTDGKLYVMKTSEDEIEPREKFRGFYKAGDDVWVHYKGEKLKGRLKEKQGLRWKLKFYGKDGTLYVHVVAKDKIEPR